MLDKNREPLQNVIADSRMTADEIIRLLKLQPHPKENGFFVETYRSAGQIPASALDPSYNGPRNYSTAIFFLLKDKQFSEIHRLKSDEIFHFYLGAPLQVLLLESNEYGRTITLGNRMEAGEQPLLVIPKGTWQGMQTTGDFTLFGCTVAPGFDYYDYEAGNRDALIRRYPDFADLIRQLTR